MKFFAVALVMGIGLTMATPKPASAWLSGCMTKMTKVLIDAGWPAIEASGISFDICITNKGLRLPV